jgi:hypothetical protein
MASLEEAMSPDRPNAVKVGPFTYEIEWLDNGQWLTNGHSDDFGGLSDHEPMVIRMRATDARSEDSLRETLLHEVLHCVGAVIGINHFTPVADDENNAEEKIVTMTSPTLLGVLRDNPGVLAYLISDGAAEQAQ